MSLKSEMKAKEVQTPDYPYLGILVGNECYVVLFTSHGVGTVVSTTYQYIRQVGEYSENWCTDSFVPYDGQVILENA